MSCYTLQDQGGCGCATPTNTTLKITGCGGLALPSAPFSVVQGGATVATGTTGVGGTYALSLPDNTPIDVTCTASRFTSHTFSGITPVAGVTTTVAMAPYVDTSAYACSGICAYPLKQTLYATVTGLPAATAVTWNGTRWVHAGLNYPGCSGGGCAAVAGTITLALDPTQTSWFSAFSLTYPSSTGLDGACPTSGGAMTSKMPWQYESGGSNACFDPSGTAFSMALNNGNVNYPYGCGFSVTVLMTE